MPRRRPMADRGVPANSASAKKPPASAIEIRFEIVIVRRSLDAAKAIKAGNSNRRMVSRIMLRTLSRPAFGSVNGKAKRLRHVAGAFEIHATSA